MVEHTFDCSVILNTSEDLKEKLVMNTRDTTLSLTNSLLSIGLEKTSE